MLCLLSADCRNDLLRSGSCRLNGRERKLRSDCVPKGGVVGGLEGGLEEESGM